MKYRGKTAFARERLARGRFSLKWASMRMSGNCSNRYRDLIQIICDTHTAVIEAVKSLLILISGHYRKFDEIEQEYINEYFVRPSSKKSAQELIDVFQLIDPKTHALLRTNVYDDAKFLDAINAPTIDGCPIEKTPWDEWLKIEGELNIKLLSAESVDEQTYHKIALLCLQKAQKIITLVEAFFG